jgi:hypothetical protein
MPNSFKSRSEESINMKFSPSDWHGKFEGSADYFAPNVQKASSARGRASPTRGRPPQRNATGIPQPSQSNGAAPVPPFPQTQAQYPPYPIPPPPPGPPPNLNFPPPNEQGVPVAKFKPEEWNKLFKDPTWALPDKKETSPRRASEATKRPKPARKPSVAQDKKPKTQDQSNPPPSKKYQATADDVTNGDTDAMDIDSGTPPAADANKNKAGSGAAPASAQIHATVGAMPNGSATAPPSATTVHPSPPGLNGVGTAMINEETFAPPRTDNLGMNGVGDALPFESKASNSHPTKPNTAQKLKFPHMPAAPVMPHAYDQVFVDMYFQKFEQYCKDYMHATKAMTAHFVARDAELASDLPDRFAHHRGEMSKKIGFPGYLARMKEDEQVLMTWNTYQEHHLKALAQCEEVRNKSMKLYQTPVA